MLAWVKGAAVAAVVVSLAAVVLPVTGEALPDAPIPLTPTIPADVNPQIRGRLLAEGDLVLAHRLFERQQWAAFVALNWPVDGTGRPQPAIGDPGAPQWSTWTEVYQIFKPDGAEPDAWGAASRSLPLADRVQRPVLEGGSETPTPPVDSGNARILHGLSSVQRLSVADEVDQAFSFAVFDQNGNPAHYEMLVNEVEYRFIVDNGLYHAGGLAEYVRRNGKLTFPAGRFEANRIGAIELKLAWRILDPAVDDFTRYLTQAAYIPAATPAGGFAWTPVTVGLVGFHIAQKTETSPQWIWSTFEHVDNVAVDRLQPVKTADGRSLRLRPSFNDPDCEWCPVNVGAPVGADGKRRTQVARLTPIPRETQALNKRMQASLAEAGSVLQFYEMVGTQWPTDPAAPPESGAAFPGAVANMAGGKPMPVYLANAVMETFSQVGNAPADQQQRATSTRGTLVFGNGSCMGCHYTSPYDFSWIMTKAQPRPTVAGEAPR
jgi:hypothetical protein